MYAQIALISALTSQTLAHMMLDYPAPFNSSNNPHRTTAPDPYLQYPYDCCGPNSRWVYPCRGYEKLLGTPEGAPTATWEAGSKQNWSISGIGNHYGGSCQVGFSTDEGASFHVATSYEGNCPHRDAGNGPAGQEFDFTVPSDIAGITIFAWIWYNREQELNMNCAAVKITAPRSEPQASSTFTAAGTYSTPTKGSGPSSTDNSYVTANGCSCTCESPVDIPTCTCNCPARAYAARDMHNHSRHKRALAVTTLDASSTSVKFADRPLMFVADNGNDCATPKSTAELKFPDAGPDVVEGDGMYPLQLPSGGCDVSAMLEKQSYHGAARRSTGSV